MFGSHVWKSYSFTQSVLVLSSGEAEFYAAIRGTQVILSMRSFLADFGKTCNLRLTTDSSVAKGILSRRGIGRMRHLHTAALWVQGIIAKGEVKAVKVLGTKNPADLFTKYLDSSKSQKIVLDTLPFSYREGRSKARIKIV